VGNCHQATLLYNNKTSAWNNNSNPSNWSSIKSPSINKSHNNSKPSTTHSTLPTRKPTKSTIKSRPKPKLSESTFKKHNSGTFQLYLKNLPPWLRILKNQPSRPPTSHWTLWSQKPNSPPTATPLNQRIRIGTSTILVIKDHFQTWRPRGITQAHVPTQSRPHQSAGVNTTETDWWACFIIKNQAPHVLVCHVMRLNWIPEKTSNQNRTRMRRSQAQQCQPHQTQKVISAQMAADNTANGSLQISYS
jgi:hypothetical protein